MSLERTLDEAYQKYREDRLDYEFFPSVLRYARALLRIKGNRLDPTVADDAASKIFLELGRYDGQSKFSTWAYRLISNCIADAARQRPAPTDQVELKETDLLDNSLDLADSRVLLLSLLKILEPTDKAILMLRIRGFNEAGIAQKLRLAESTIFRRWGNIKEKLALHMESAK